MTIYASKNARGELTGTWVVEVMQKGKKIKKHFREFAEAKAMEVSLFLGTEIEVTTKERKPCYTIRRLQKDARIIWHATKDKSQSLQRFDACMLLLGLDTALSSIRTAQLDALVAKLRARKLSDVTIHRYLCTVSAAMKWAEARELIASRPIFPWDSLKKGEARRDTLSIGDERRIMQFLRAKGEHDICVVMAMLLTTGMRIGELTSLTPDDFDGETLTVTIGNWEGRTKNGEIRVVPISANIIVRAMALASRGWPPYQRINIALRRAREAIGIKHRVTPHVIRHTVATRLNAAKVPVITIMDVLGHRSMATTKGYVHTNTETLREAVESLPTEIGAELPEPE